MNSLQSFFNKYSKLINGIYILDRILNSFISEFKKHTSSRTRVD